jgi:hypothetical protein
MSSNFITRNDQLKGALLETAIDAGYRLAVKNNKLYIVDMLESDLGGFPLAIPVKFTGEGLEDLDVVQWGTISPEDSIEPVFRTMYEVVHGEPPKPVMIKGTPISTKHEDVPPISTKLAEDTNFWPRAFFD